MFDIEKVREFVAEKKYDFIVDVRLRPSDNVILLYVQQEKIIGKAKKGFTSNRQLEFIKKKIISNFDRATDVIVVQSENHYELEAGIYQILNRKYDDKIISLYLSFSGEKSVNVWIEVEGINEGLRIDIEDHLRDVLAEANIDINEISWITLESELPTLAALLRTIKVHQPIDINDLLELLLENCSSISDKWLNRKLDQLRKKGFIRRDGSGCYVLTAMALALIPAGTWYTSSDIERALALGKRKW